MGINRRSITAGPPVRGAKPSLFGKVIGSTFLVAGSLWLVAAAPRPPSAGPSFYERATERFKKHDYQRALSLLEEAKNDPDPKAQADITNLRGMIYLRLRRYGPAEEAFAAANKLDPGLWEAQFNAAEVAFRRKDYADSARRFQELLDRTSRFGHGEERELIQYKTVLSALLAGREQEAAAYFQTHARDTRPPLAYYYLRAAVENRHQRPSEAARWLTEAGEIHSPDASQVYAESFREMGWDTARPAAQIARAASPGKRPSGLGAIAASKKPGEPATVAVVQLLDKGRGAANTIKKHSAGGEPAAPDKPDFRIGSNGEFSESEREFQLAPPDDGPPPAASAAVGPLAMAKPPTGNRRGHSPTPLPTASPAASPAANPPKSGASPSASASPESTVPGGDLPASATPAPSPEPGFIQAYEAAYVQFLQEKYDEARELLDKADKIQPGQPSSVSLRNQIFKHFYGEAYLRYASKDYEGAVAQLSAADKVLPNQADANNMRGLIFSRQKNYRSAEEMFKKSIAQDPTFWEAKFNLAELPFIYKNYPEARTRFEVLFGETDPVKQPKEAELTEFKVFLTLLLEGKETAARSFMERFNFSGATPARYYCQAALDFIHGDTDKALGWISSARKEYPAKLEGIFAQSFFRVGWLTDANAAALASATPSTEALPSVSPAMTVAAASPAASGTPTEMAMASPAKTTPPAASPTGSVATPAKPPVVAAATPTPKGTAAPIAAASATPATTGTPPPLVASAGTPAASPSRDLLSVPTTSASPATPAPMVSPAITMASPTPSPAAEAAATPAPAAASSEADNSFAASDAVALVLIAMVLGLTLVNVFIVLRVIKVKKDRLAKKPLRYSGQTAAKP